MPASLCRDCCLVGQAASGQRCLASQLRACSSAQLLQVVQQKYLLVASRSAPSVVSRRAGSSVELPLVSVTTLYLVRLCRARPCLITCIV